MRFSIPPRLRWLLLVAGMVAREERVFLEMSDRGWRLIGVDTVGFGEL